MQSNSLVLLSQIRISTVSIRIAILTRSTSKPYNPSSVNRRSKEAGCLSCKCHLRVTSCHFLVMKEELQFKIETTKRHLRLRNDKSGYANDKFIQSLDQRRFRLDRHISDTSVRRKTDFGYAPGEEKPARRPTGNLLVAAIFSGHDRCL